MKKVLFSLIIPCYNHARFLGTCLDAILQQDFQDWEAIVVNDGSTDHSGPLADTYGKMDKRIKVIHQENLGLSAARNAGLKIASGLWFQFVDADDFLLPDCLSVIAEHLLHSNAFTIWHTGHILVDEHANEIWKQNNPRNFKNFWEVVKHGGIGPPLSLFISRDLAKKTGEFDIQLRSAEDWDFWLRAAKLGASYSFIPECLVSYRYLIDSMSRSPWRMYENTKKVTLRISKPFGDSEFQWSKNLPNLSAVHKKNILQITGLALSQGKVDEALTFFQNESKQFNLNYKPEDFSQMNSFLTFRYQYSPSMVKKVLEEFRPYFEEFFRKAKYDVKFINLALLYIFSRHLKNQNLHKYGIWGRLLNYYLENRIRKLKISYAGN